MKPHLITDCSGAVLTALLVTPDGELVRCSQEIRQVAARHISQAILFDARVPEHSDFIWEDALETLAKATPQTFFQRARRIGLRRPWDGDASPDALQLASPIAVLSSPAAFADRVAAPALPRAAAALLAAQLEPVFAFAAERQPLSGVEAVVIVPSQTGRHARLVLQKIARRRGFPRLTVVRREIATAMALRSQAPCACIVAETAETDLHLHRVEIGGEAGHPHLRTTASVTLPSLGCSHWAARIAEAAQMPPSAVFERSLLALLTGSPDSLSQRLAHRALERALDAAWIDRQTIAEQLRGPLAQLGGEHLPLLFSGEVFTLPAVRAAFGTGALHTPTLDDAVRNVAAAMQSRFTVTSAADVRVNVFPGERLQLLSHALLPAPGERCRVDARYRVAGEHAGKTLLLHFLIGDATLAAMPLEVRGESDLHLILDLHRNRRGSRLQGAIEARVPGGTVGRARFAEELEVMR